MMDRQQLIDGIHELNPTAKRDWLDSFEIHELRDYWEHLQHVLEPRGKDSVWVRRGDSPAIVEWRAAG
ncbi:MAG TPA: hypothetical protein VG711_02355 [Phycisphaerales bacterium]|nr:hypothetical protein [Phycisphaerales bacterium]